MSKDRLLDLCNNTIVWADEHSRDLASDLIRGIGITSDELIELGFDKKIFSYLQKKYETESQLIYWSKIFLQKSLTKKSKIIVFN